MQRFDHSNYGSIISNDIKSFEMAIYDVLNGKHTSSIWSDNKSANEAIDLASQRSPQTTKSSALTEEDLEKLWNKWTNYQVDSYVQELCYSSVQSIKSMLQDYGQQCISAGLFPNVTASIIGAWISNALTHLGQGSFMVGLEYPDINLDSPDIRKEKPYRLMEVATAGTRDLLKIFLVKLVVNGYLAQTESGIIAEKGGKLIMTAMIECYVVGARFSPNKVGGSIFGST